MVSFLEVLNETTEFFKRHWPHSWWGEAPRWTNPWYFRGTMFGGEKQGVYSLLNSDSEVLYIGVGASLGRGIYEGSGLNSRIGKYCRLAQDQRSAPVPDRLYEPRDEWVERGLVAISTVGFESNQAYLAYSLEAYLLSVLEPPFNRVRSARKENKNR